MTFDVDSFVSSGKHAAAVIPVLIAFGYAFLRAGSAFPLLARAWRLVAGTSPISNERIAAYLRDQRDLSSFQFHSGLRPHSLRQTTQLIDWSDANDVSIERISKCGAYFDLRSLMINEAVLPSKGRTRLAGVATLVLLASTGGLLYGAAMMKYAYLSFRDDGRHFAIADDGARTLRWTLPALPAYGPALDKARCDTLSAGAAAAGFSVEQTSVLCKALGTPELDKMATENLRAQRLFVLFLAALVVGLFWSCGAWVNKTRAARTLSEELRERRSTNSGAGLATTADPT
ncbi:DUF6216 family protein [Pseudoxanthomonas wuyuanensis]|uniref:Uncharacterized protein n=1 Tax=Pseudoxanthomonas wuyuanensis TaxID=1073196 RepID=A0A286D829_9GAMM|nr:DUF6216 family protein [Pseudoxanthomonas wuyuanensis]KAF1720154.1 hypothetical protein CSC75_12425 [Pseudoxanthomonas wuyuanensis]SOD54783.1 hypothetical protein SAMN06296416_10543 [Pseudoxanthomonas wuyuanensis]